MGGVKENGGRLMTRNRLFRPDVNNNNSYFIDLAQTRRLANILFFLLKIKEKY